MSKWLVVGPFDNEGKGGMDRSFGPDDERTKPIAVAHSYEGKERLVHWRVAPDVSTYGWLDFGAFMRPTENACAYATTFVRDARSEKTKGKIAPRPISVWLGAAGAVRAWWNGAEIAEDAKYRGLDSDRLAASVTLERGWNRLVVKVCNDEDAPMASVRLADARGLPDANLDVDDDPSRSLQGQAAPQKTATSKAKGPALPPPGAPHVEGALQAFEARAKGGDAATLEEFARYLVMTSGDDPADHRARELARKAAEKAPSIERLLLAGDLAEGRNQRASWIDKAAALVKPGTPFEERKDVLLARGQHARGGANFRDAIPLYDGVLALDPDDVSATLARFELYDAADLHETALAFLRDKLARRPRSVALLRAVAAALRGENRTTEADEMEERYASLRFDDPGVMRAKIERAIADRDAARASRWIDRLLSTHPDASASLVSGAQAYMQLGDRPRAVALFKRALDLAPEDTDTMRLLADAYGVMNRSDEQLKLLRRVLELKPQDKDTREYVAHREPSKPRPDEQYARQARGVPREAHRAGPRREQADARRSHRVHGLPERPREPLPPDGLPAAHRVGGERRAPVRLRLRVGQPSPCSSAARRCTAPTGASTRRSRAAKGTPTTRRSRRTRASAPTTCTFPACTRVTSSSCSTASRTSRRGTPSPTTSAR